MQITDIARRRIAALLLIAALIVGALALADLGPFDDPSGRAEDDVEATVDGLFSAAAAGDFKSFCALLTPRARETLRENAARLGGGETPPCARTLELTLGESLEGSRVSVEDVSVSGPHARVTARFRPPEGEAELRTVYLDELEGEWLISDPGG